MRPSAAAPASYRNTHGARFELVAVRSDTDGTAIVWMLDPGGCEVGIPWVAFTKHFTEL